MISMRIISLCCLLLTTLFSQTEFISTFIFWPPPQNSVDSPPTLYFMIFGLMLNYHTWTFWAWNTKMCTVGAKMTIRRWQMTIRRWLRSTWNYVDRKILKICKFLLFFDRGTERWFSIFEYFGPGVKKWTSFELKRRLTGGYMLIGTIFI